MVKKDEKAGPDGKESAGRGSAAPREAAKLPPAKEAAVRLRRIQALQPRAMISDAALVSGRLDFLERRYRERAPDRDLLRELGHLEKGLQESGRVRERRARGVPAVSYPRELPITARKDEIVQSLRGNRVLIISGETGCGKSTQIPKICLEAGRGISGRIACTQPRRIAAVTIAHRIADELREPLGRSVGYKIRFQDRTSPDAYVKVMTDGMLLAETQGDRRLTEYDTLLIDEAHERSLNIDFLLGIARTLLDARPELSLIITSATLDIEKFRTAFPGAPVVEVSGRTYPVEVEYRPPADEDPEEWDYVDHAVQAVAYLKREKPAGDILVFMPTEQDIMETIQRLEGRKYPGTIILPLFSRLPAAQQGRVYSVEGPKIVVATNVAETSLTIPGIKYVVDTGLARIAQYQPGSHINALPVRPISQASAAQRQGRCGRVQAGLCVRLYSEKDYRERPAFTPPEILRSDLAEVALRMLDLRLGDPLAFPFIDRPTARAVRAGYETLFELGAIRQDERGAWVLTDAGRSMARMPLDPRVSRMLLEAARTGCVREVAAIAAVLSIRDPRERPPDQAAKADEAHARFRHPDSDFLTLLNVWDRYHDDLPAGASQGQRRRWCHEHFVSFVRMREWQLLHGEILAVLADHRLPLGRREQAELSPGLYAAVHRAILTGFLANIAAHKEKSLYNAAKNREAMIFPGSTLFGRPPGWIVAAEMVLTSRLFARTAARVDPGWLEELGGELCRRTYSEPAWDRTRGEVVAKERVTLFGLEIVRDRRVSYGRINPEEAHAIFVREALIEGDVDRPPAFLIHNLALQRKVAAMEDKLRRRDIMVGEDRIAAFYDERLPGVMDLRTLEKLIRDHGDEFLKLEEADLLNVRPDPAALDGFPDRVEVGGREFRAEYVFTPGTDEDGLTLKVPLNLLATIPGERLEWGVAGLLRPKVEAMVRGLEKRYRKLLTPAAESAAVIAQEMESRLEREEGSLSEAIAGFVKARFRVDIPASAWAAADIPNHLKTRLAVTDPAGRVVVAGRDLEVVKMKVGAADAAPAKMESPAWIKAQEKWERDKVTGWDFGTLPESVTIATGLSAYPALAAGEAGVSLRLFPTLEGAKQAHRAGVGALLRAKYAKDLDFVRRYHRIPADYERPALYFGGRAAVEKAVEAALVREVFVRDIRTEEEFRAYDTMAGRALMEKGHALTQAALKVMDGFQRIRAELGKAVSEGPAGAAASGTRTPRKERGSSWVALGAAAEKLGAGRAELTAPAFKERIEAELDALVPRDFLEVYALERLSHLPRYLEALKIRLERARIDPEKDRQKWAQVEPFVLAFERLRRRLAPATEFDTGQDAAGRDGEPGAPSGELGLLARRRAAQQGKPAPPASPEKLAALEELRWMIEEFKVALFAPEVKTAYPISTVRLARKIKDIEGPE
jgi:ATP-dependent RNA helicase HrpA